MARKLFRFADDHRGAGFGVRIYGCGSSSALAAGRAGFTLKVGVVVLLILYHAYCGVLLRTFERGENRRSDKWYRMFNELPVLGMLAAVALVVIKPF